MHSFAGEHSGAGVSDPIAHKNARSEWPRGDNTVIARDSIIGRREALPPNLFTFSGNAIRVAIVRADEQLASVQCGSEPHGAFGKKRPALFAGGGVEAMDLVIGGRAKINIAIITFEKSFLRNLLNKL